MRTKKKLSGAQSKSCSLMKLVSLNAVFKKMEESGLQVPSSLKERSVQGIQNELRFEGVFSSPSEMKKRLKQAKARGKRIAQRICNEEKNSHGIR